MISIGPISTSQDRRAGARRPVAKRQGDPRSTPEVECIGKGTAIALSEFRRKASMPAPVTYPTMVTPKRSYLQSH
jgi:hypothetical protein